MTDSLRRRCSWGSASVVALMLLSMPVMGQEETILDLYRELQVAQPNAIPAYEVTPDARGKDVVRILFPADPAARVEAEYDRRFDYLRITRLETGEQHGPTPGPNRRDVLEMALWLDAEGAPLLGVSERRLRGDVPETGRLRFFSRSSGRWNAVTAEVAPALSANICGQPDGVVDDEAAQAGQPVAAFLPLQETRISLWCLSPAASASRGMTLVWNAELGIFEPDALPSVPAPWVQKHPPQ